MERWRAGKEEAENNRKRATRGKGSRRGGSYKERDIGQGGPRRPI